MIAIIQDISEFFTRIQKNQLGQRMNVNILDI